MLKEILTEGKKSKFENYFEGYIDIEDMVL